MSELPELNRWSIARHAGTERITQRRSITRAGTPSPRWRGAPVRGGGLEEAARRGKRRRGLVIGAIDETGQEKAGEATAGVKRQYMGCAGRVANGINTVHLSYVRDKTGHALIGARQWIPREHIEDPVKSLLMGLPLDLGFRTKGQLAIDICADAYADGIRFDFACGNRLRQLHAAARVPRGQRPGLRAAGAVEFHAHPRGRDEDDLRGSGQGAAEGQAALRSAPPAAAPRRTLVRLGLARHRISAPSPRRRHALDEEAGAAFYRFQTLGIALRATTDGKNRPLRRVVPPLRK